MKSVRVPLSKNPYSIYFGDSRSGVPAALRKTRLRPSRIFLITTSAVMKAGYPGKLAARLKSGRTAVETAVIPNGESAKSIETFKSLCQRAVRSRLDRRSVIAAVGGGVVTDLAGFVAAAYMRGIPYFSVPTTLLSMVDASVGGKTGVDLPEGKNLVGAFHQPSFVWIDTSMLRSLSERDWKTGFAEIIKYGIIKDAAFFRWLEGGLRRNSDVSSWSRKDVLKAVVSSVRIKAAVVGSDEKESPLKGGREILNFGHTVGHALEAATVYGRLTHGEAISVGMAAAGHIAARLNLWSLGEHLRVLLILQSLGLPIHCEPLTQREKTNFWEALRSDKKNVGGRLRFVLPVRIGKVIVRSGITPSVVRSAMNTVGFKTETKGGSRK